MTKADVAKAKDSKSSKGAHDADLEDVYEEPPFHRTLIYDFVLWLLINIFNCFFREIRSRGGYKIPKQGPVIFVAAPHANQFVDPVILVGQIRKSVNQRISFLIAAKSLKMKVVGFLARCIMSIGVVRPQDNLKSARGKISLDPENPLKINGQGTKFLEDVQPRGLLGLPKSLGFVEIQTIESDTVLYIRKEFKTSKPEIKSLLTKGCSFKFAPKVDQSKVYHQVFEHLNHKGSIGIFPEGGSHDRPDLLPLKAGVAIMALGCMDKHAEANVKIVPCGMNYFHPHKFRSRAVVEFGDPIEIPRELVVKYGNPETNKEAVKELLDTVTEGLKAVTVNTPDYETLMVVQAMRRLYTAQLNTKLSLPMIVEMNRRIVKYYQTYKDDPEFRQLKNDILKYNSHLQQFNIPDHLVETAKVDFTKNLCLLVFRSITLFVSVILALPGILLFSPIFLVSKRISEKKARQALANSTVKITAKDVVATWKILMAMVFAPLLYIFWSLLFTLYYGGSHNKILTFCISYVTCSLVTYSALIIGDMGMDTFKSLRPLYISLTSPKGLKKLQKERLELSDRITEVMNTLGAELFMDIDTHIYEDEIDEEAEDRKTAELKRRRMLRKKKEKLQKMKLENISSENTSEVEQTQESDAISLMNSDNSLSNIPFFSTGVDRPSSSASSVMAESSSSDFEVENFESKGNNISDKIAKAIWEKRHGEKEE
ncbi:hypothetical protein Kpol_1025p48 [Vanderwaltozyma polyspora DSM 70294]|uniref:Phospholipid/glycerol acyltransferase domain-containing protein n=1 Tax=Vanderwaltozyma polyspora (strain ATCC 22028 / DSM 70294 / BCRC 21397 / CBS 2163 / NBRC 10782 / NRRL Y-8283 / UCD 57-17) TaxID=436907 RepID=A7TKX2_VANPO|nr:uncharacterized protein Kpol_1025p48 [Vanderwaltozyma polyspora DSM 70294]EDO17127.1 hypothetical protein Kpol_1025p48 [Vanderwaltozyma polyspora DSM 70294]